nr:MAG TPA: hypothetical protein [Caudoviricetes sp.]
MPQVEKICGIFILIFREVVPIDCSKSNKYRNYSRRSCGICSKWK